jgi:hypothetical protein
MNIPRIFNDKGELIDVDVSRMDAATLARLEIVRTAYRAHRDAQDALTAAYAEVTAALEAVKNTTEFFDAHFPRQTFLDLWRENFAGGPRNRMAGLGRI